MEPRSGDLIGKYVPLAAGLALSLMVPGPVLAQADAVEPAGQTESLGSALNAMGKGNPVLARVDGHEIRWADVEASARELPENLRGDFETIMPALLGRLIDRRLLVTAGREAGLTEDPEVRRQVQAFEDRAVSEAFVEQVVAATIDNAELRARYDDYRRQLADRAQVHARHILLNRREDALDVIAQLDKGADFAQLARARSIAPSAAQGGDMDYFTRESMAPDFAELAFRLEVGHYSAAPLHTAFGWHVIKIEDRREETPRSFFDMREELRQAAIKDRLAQVLADLRRQAQIDLFPQDAGAP